MSLIEGCLGLYDSPGNTDWGTAAAVVAAAAADDGGCSSSSSSRDQGSTAQMAEWLQVPLVLIIDGQAFSTPRSVVALVRGYAAGDASCHIAAVVLNKVPRQSLAAEAQAALSKAGLDVAVLGSLPKVRAVTCRTVCAGAASQTDSLAGQS